MSRFYDPIEQAILDENGYRYGIGEDLDPPPILKLFAVNGYSIWLITELSSFYPGMGYGMADLGEGFIELGQVFIPDLETVQQGGVPAIERDYSFKAHYPLSVYLQAAMEIGKFTNEFSDLALAKAKLDHLTRD